jgi:proteasome assembly chaperone (PAC2) family protein
MDNRAICEIMVKKLRRAVKATDDNIIRHMRIEGWMIKATDTHLEFVIIIAFLWLEIRMQDAVTI